MPTPPWCQTQAATRQARRMLRMRPRRVLAAYGPATYTTLMASPPEEDDPGRLRPADLLHSPSPDRQAALEAHVHVVVNSGKRVGVGRCVQHLVGDANGLVPHGVVGIGPGQGVHHLFPVRVAVEPGAELVPLGDH